MKESHIYRSPPNAAVRGDMAARHAFSRVSDRLGSCVVCTYFVWFLERCYFSYFCLANSIIELLEVPIRLALFDRYFFECWRVATRPEMCFSRRVGDVYPFPLGCVGVARNKFGCRLEASARAKSTLVVYVSQYFCHKKKKYTNHLQLVSTS